MATADAAAGSGTAVAVVSDRTGPGVVAVVFENPAYVAAVAGVFGTSTSRWATPLAALVAITADSAAVRAALVNTSAWPELAFPVVVNASVPRSNGVPNAVVLPMPSGVRPTV